jgi:hypothetical protein
LTAVSTRSPGVVLFGALAACALGACAGSSQRVDSSPTSTASSSSPERPPNAIDELAASYAKEHGLELMGVESALLPQPPEGRPARLSPPGLQPPEALLEDATGQLVFVAPPIQWSCEPAPRADYRFARAADGGLVILRVQPVVHVVTKHLEGSCGVGCGPVPPPPQTPLYKVPKAERVDLVNVPYDVTVEQITCDRPLPRP